MRCKGEIRTTKNVGKVAPTSETTDDNDYTTIIVKSAVRTNSTDDSRHITQFGLKR